MRDIYFYYAANGGVINGAIFAVAVAVFYIGLGKMSQYRRFASPACAGTAPDGAPTCCCETHEVFFGGGEHSVGHYRNAFREKLLEVVPRLESGLDSMAALIQVAPFLGLFGTVVGMIETFTLITTYGTANPVILTEGITVSLLTTQAGLLVAFPCMLFHNYLTGRKDALVRNLLAEGERLVSEAAKDGARHDV